MPPVHPMTAVRVLLVVCSLLLGAACGPQSSSRAPEAARLEVLPGRRNEALAQVAAKTGIRVEVLAAFAYQQSRFEAPTGEPPPLPQAPVPSVHPDEQAGEAPEPERYGIMVLTPAQVNWGAQLTGWSAEQIKRELVPNLEAAAAILQQLAQAMPTLATEQAILEATLPFVGLEPGTDAAQLYREELEKVLRQGFDVVTFDQEHLVLEGVELGQASAALAAGDYPPLQWIASPSFSSRDGNPIQFVIMHDMEGTQPGAVSRFIKVSEQVSAHYLLRASDGHVIQMVHEADTAWHCGNYAYNQHSIGIEHEGFADYPGGRGYYTPTQYQASAALVCAIARKYHIPIDRAHLFGHGNVPTSGFGPLCSDAQAVAGICGGSRHHHDPGRYWDWVGYLDLIARCVRPNTPARGAIDEASCDTVAGWAQDPDQPTQAIGVQIFFDGAPGKAAAERLMQANANRPDLCASIGSCAHGFSLKTPLSFRSNSSHTVQAYGVDSAGGATSLLAPSPRTVTCSGELPDGVLRHVVDPGSLAAWKLDLFWQAIRPNAAQLAARRVGPALPHQPRLVQATDGTPQVWVIDGSYRRHLPDPAAAAAWGFDLGKVEKLPAADVDAFVEGTPWRSSPVLAMDGPTVYLLDDPPPPGPSSAIDGGVGDEGPPPGLSPTEPMTGSPLSVTGGCAAVPGAPALCALLALLFLRRRAARG